MSGEMAGALGERVTFARREEARDAIGGAEGAWVPFAECWAGIVPAGVGAFDAGQAVSALARWRVTIRRGPDVRVGDRIGWGARAMIVRAVIDDPGMRDRIVCQAEELR